MKKHIIVNDPENRERFKQLSKIRFLCFSFGGKQHMEDFLIEPINMRKGDRIDVGLDYCVENAVDPRENNILFFNKEQVYDRAWNFLLPVKDREIKFHRQFLSNFGGIESKNHYFESCSTVNVLLVPKKQQLSSFESFI